MQQPGHTGIPQCLTVPVDGRRPQQINEWRNDYNENRQHSAYGNLTPNAFTAQPQPT
ncbi:transposase [Stappia sp. GBMRC 2046]|uniref:Transposase n=1 Tax=Stappia sediminis TaxID=2692190 RepID=A0A7X3S828_9HYPH|nr:transposase [Stappia sediminis]